jgi:RNA polymerase sigma factor (sigma-70 family)
VRWLQTTTPRDSPGPIRDCPAVWLYTTESRDSPGEALVDEVGELGRDVVDAVEVVPPDLDEFPTEQPKSTFAAGIGGSGGGSRVPSPALALDADQQVGNRQIELGEEGSIRRENGVLVDQREPTGMQRLLGEALEPAPGKAAVDAFVEELENQRGSRHARTSPLQCYLSDPDRIVTTAEHAVECLADSVATAATSNLEESDGPTDGEQAVDLQTRLSREFPRPVDVDASEWRVVSATEGGDVDLVVVIESVAHVESACGGVGHCRITSRSKQASPHLSTPGHRRGGDTNDSAVDSLPLSARKAPSGEPPRYADFGELARRGEAILGGEESSGVVHDSMSDIAKPRSELALARRVPPTVRRRPNALNFGVSICGPAALKGMMSGTEKALRVLAPPSSFADFYRDEAAGQVRRAALLVGSADLANDIVHEAFVQIFRRWQQLDHPGPYLNRAVLNECRDVGRGRRRQSRLVSRLASTAQTSWEHDSLADVLDVLPFNQRAVVVLRFYAGFNNLEIADALGCPPGSVGPWLDRALKQLRKALS